MDQDTLRNFENRCIQEEPAACQAACPFKLDVRSFIRHLKKDNFEAARAILEKGLPIPEILGRICNHPCHEKCLRRDLGGPVSIGELERTCLNAAPVGRAGFSRPPKDFKLAIWGAGLSSLTAAYELSAKGYQPLWFFEGASAPHETLWPILADKYFGGDENALADKLPKNILAQEFEKILAKGVKLANQPFSECFPGLADNYDAVFVEAGQLPENFTPELAKVCALTGSVGENYKICYGGFQSSVIHDAAEGKRGAVTIERVLAKASPLASRVDFNANATKLYTPLEGIEPLPPTSSCQQEAARCLDCQCLVCVKECAYLEHYRAYPKSYARQIFLNVTMVKGQHLANPLINSCTMCGQCQVLCPNDFSMARLIVQARREMVMNGHMPPSAHEFALEDLAETNHPDNCLFLPGAAGQTSHLFFPGCQLAASRGAQVVKIHEHLNRHFSEKCGLALACCGVPAEWAGREKLFAAQMEFLKNEWEKLGRPKIILACSSCLKTFKEALPEMDLTSLWEVLAYEAPCPSVFKPEGRYAVHDPCSARHNHGWQEAVRTLLDKNSINYSEPENSRKKTSCCGYGGLVWKAHPEMATKITQKMADGLSEPALVSCIMCRDRLVEGGHPALHLLDVICPPDNGSYLNQKGPGLSERRRNRLKLKNQLLKNSPQEVSETVDLKLEISPELLAEMEKRYILIQDLQTVLAQAENGGQRFYDQESGHFLATFRPRNVSFWVEYSLSGKSFIIHDAYSHRMGTPSAQAKGETG